MSVAGEQWARCGGDSPLGSKTSVCNALVKEQGAGYVASGIECSDESTCSCYGTYPGGSGSPDMVGGACRVDSAAAIPEEEDEEFISDTVSAVEAHNKLPKGSQQKTTSTDGPNQSLSGSTENKRPNDIPAVDVQKVIDRARELGHELRNGGAYDNGVPGSAAASHAEKQAIVKNPHAKHIDVSRKMCDDCQAFMSKEAQKQNRTILVTDPKAARAFKPDGTVVVTPRPQKK